MRLTALASDPKHTGYAVRVRVHREGDNERTSEQRELHSAYQDVRADTGHEAHWVVGELCLVDLREHKGIVPLHLHRILVVNPTWGSKGGLKQYESTVLPFFGGSLDHMDALKWTSVPATLSELISGYAPATHHSHSFRGSLASPSGADARGSLGGGTDEFPGVCAVAVVHLSDEKVQAQKVAPVRVATICDRDPVRCREFRSMRPSRL